MPILEHLWIILALPLAGAALNGLLGKSWSKTIVNSIGIGSVSLAFLSVLEAIREFSLLPAGQLSFFKNYFNWMSAGSFKVDFALQMDHLTIVMLLVVTFVSLLVHVYSTGYMAHEEGYYRFFAYLNLFVFFMLTLVLAANVVLMFVGWEGVGLCSYLLIGFWFLKQSAINAGKKAFITTRIGDFGFTVGILLLFWTFGSVDFGTVFAKAANMPAESATQAGVLTWICLLLFAGAIGKSAQLPLYVWLPDAMEGPTPVSALIHAATMVTAGVYMVARMHALFSRAPIAMFVVAAVGAITAFYAATIGLVQTDIKKVLAYSHRVAIGLHVSWLWSRSIRGGDFPSDDARVFQRLALLGRRQRDSCDGWRARHAQHGRAAKTNSCDFLDDVHCYACDCGNSRVCRILQQGRNFGCGWFGPERSHHALATWTGRRGADVVLYVPADISYLFRQAAI